MRKMFIIFPQYTDFTTPLNSIVLMYPETETVPSEQLNKVRRWLNMTKHDKILCIVTVSPYVLECAIKSLDKEDIEFVYSDGKNESLDPNFIFKYMADPMASLSL